MGGPRSNAPCVFPFKFKGVLYESCTSAEYTQNWCATKVGSNNSYIDDEWGNCNSDCFGNGISFDNSFSYFHNQALYFIFSENSLSIKFIRF